MQVCNSPNCPNPPMNGFLCRNCGEQLRRDLSAVPWLVKDLHVTISRQDRIGDATGRCGGEKPLPLRLHAVEARRDLHATLAAWAQHLAGRFDGLARDTVWTEVRLAVYLLAHLDTANTDPAAGQLADEIGYATHTAHRAIDKPAERLFVGPCDDCALDLYVHPSRAEVECANPDCARIYDITTRRAWLLGKAEDQLLTATALSRALPGLLQRPVTASFIRSLAYRGRLTQHPPLPDRPNDPTYRLGDLLDVLREMSEEETRGRPAC